MSERWCVHTPDQPEGYLAWHRWAEEKNKTHRPIRCKGCGLFIKWIARANKTAKRGNKKTG